MTPGRQARRRSRKRGRPYPVRHFNAGGTQRKASQILAISRRVADAFGGTLPCERNLLLPFDGVGPKCANLVLGIACGAPFISVDVHVHRVTGRWGYVQAASPGKALLALETRLPRSCLGDGAPVGQGPRFL